MGARLTTQQKWHAKELQQILRQAGSSVGLGHVEHFLKEIKCRCPSYPEQGSLKPEDWTGIGKKLHEKPQASTQNLWLWWRCQDAIGKISIVGASPKASSLITPVPSSPPAYHSPSKKVEQSTVRAAVATAKGNGELSVEDMQEFESDLYAFPVTCQQEGDGNVIAEWTSLPFSVSSPSISSVPIGQLTTESPLSLGSLFQTTPLSSFSLAAIILPELSLPSSASSLPAPEDSCRSAFQETVKRKLKQSKLPSETSQTDAKSNSLVKHHSSPSFLSPEKASIRSFALPPVSKQPPSALQTIAFATLSSSLVKKLFDPGIKNQVFNFDLLKP